MPKQETARRESGSGDADAAYEQELTELLEDRIKPGLNRGSIPLLARALAKDIAARQRSGEAEEDDEPRDEDDEEERTGEPQASGERDDEPDEDEPEAELEEEESEEEEPEEEEPEAEVDEDDDEDVEEDAEAEDEDEPADDITAFEEEMHQLQEDLGDEWIVRFSVQNDEAWLTAEKEDGTQHVEGPTADVLREAVELLEGGGGDD